MRPSCSGALYGLGLLGGGLAQTTTVSSFPLSDEYDFCNKKLTIKKSFFFGINDIGEQTGSVIGSVSLMSDC